MRWGRGCPLPPARRGLGRGLDLCPEKFLLFDLKMEHFGAVFQLDLMEERHNCKTRQLLLSCWRQEASCWFQIPEDIR